MFMKIFQKVRLLFNWDPLLFILRYASTMWYFEKYASQNLELRNEIQKLVQLLLENWAKIHINVIV